MKLILYLVVLVCLAQSASAQNRFSMDDYTKMSVEEKRSLFSDIVSPEIDDPKKFLDLFILALQDPDALVRRRATQKFSFTMVGLQRLKKKGAAIPVGLSEMAEVQRLLVAKLSDPDTETRGAATLALSYSGAPDPEIEAALLDQFRREPNEQLKGGIIETLGFAGYESKTYKQAVLNSLLDSSEDVRDASSKAAAQIKPSGALPLLVQALERFTSGRHLAVNAIAAYGAESLPYLPQLEKLMADPSIPGDLRDRVGRAIEAIKNPKPEAKAEPKVKAVALVDTSQPQAPAPPAPPVATPAPSTPVPTATPAPSSPAPIVAESSAPVVERKSPIWPWLVGILALVVIVACALKRRG